MLVGVLVGDHFHVVDDGNLPLEEDGAPELEHLHNPITDPALLAVTSQGRPCQLSKTHFRQVIGKENTVPT
eukprot:6474806-Amphidinium_carterae.1